MAKKQKFPSRKTSSTNGKAAAVDCAQAVVEEETVVKQATVVDQEAAEDDSEPKLNYRDAVRKGKELAAARSVGMLRSMMALGELADGVVKSYNEGKLKQFAKDIGDIADCALARCRSVYRAWKPVYRAWKKGPAPFSYSVAQTLQAHPDRFDIVRDNPNLTKRDARQIMNDWKQRDQPPKDDRTVAGIRRWWTSYLERHIELIKEGRSLDGVASDIIRQAIEPTTLGTPIRSIAASQKIVDRVRDAHDETPEDEVVERGTPPDETVERDPLDETPDETVERDPLDETPDEAVERSPSDETPAEASDETPAEADAPSLLEETPDNETPDNETPDNETPDNETPDNETPDVLMDETPEPAN